MDDVILRHRAAFLRPVRTNLTCVAERERLILAINEAEQLGFENTKAALISMLYEHEAQAS